MPVSKELHRMHTRGISLITWLVFLVLIAPAALAGGRNHVVLPEIGFGGGVQDSRTGAMSLVKLDLSGSFEHVTHRGSYGVIARVGKFWLPPTQRISRIHIGVLGYYDLGRPLALRHLRVGLGPMITNWERAHETYGGYGVEAEISVGFRKFADWWLLGFYDNGDVTYSRCVMTGFRISMNLFRLIKNERVLHWR